MDIANFAKLFGSEDRVDFWKETVGFPEFYVFNYLSSSFLLLFSVLFVTFCLLF